MYYKGKMTMFSVNDCITSGQLCPQGEFIAVSAFISF